MGYNAGIAIFIALIAGSATVLGGMLSLLLTKHMKPLTFAAALAFAAGCTLTVAFADVLPEGQEAWHRALSSGDHDEDHELEEMHASTGLLVMLVGWLMASLFDTTLHLSLDAYDHYYNSDGEHFHVGVCAHDHAHDHTHASHTTESVNDNVIPMIDSQDSHSDLEAPPGDGLNGELAHHQGSAPESQPKRGFWGRLGHLIKRMIISKSTLQPNEQRAIDYQFRADAKRISRLGYFTACVLALHNIPEGIALYGTLMVDGKSGIGLAVAIALHNLPQGMAVAVPIYIGHNSKFQAILFSAAAALAQPLGALIGFGIVGTNPSPTLMSVMLLLTSGVLFNASLKELYGSAVRYDRGNQLCGTFIFIGMFVLSCTLICIAYV